MKGWKPVDSEQAYLSFDEQIVISARLHPITAVLPVFKVLVVGVALILASTSLWPVAIVFGLLAVQWIRKEGYVGNLGFFPVVILVGLLWYGTQQSLEVGARILLFLAVCVFVLVKGLVEYVFNRLYLTDKRIMLRSGILTERRSTLPLRALTDMRYDQTIPGRVFDYGHFFVESAGQNQALSTLLFVDNPVKFYRIAMQLALGGTIPPEELIQG
jgi:Bacterial PH domain